ncbi:MAG: hypothetical protein ABI607_01130 [Betaproteobacteria bacterium]
MEGLLNLGLGTQCVAKAPAQKNEPDNMSATPEGRSSRAAAVFATLWLAIALGSPLIVRYAPSTDDRAMEALVQRIEQSRCAKTADLGSPCVARILVAQGSRPASQPDI